MLLLIDNKGSNLLKMLLHFLRELLIQKLFCGPSRSSMNLKPLEREAAKEVQASPPGTEISGCFYVCLIISSIYINSVEKEVFFFNTVFFRKAQGARLSATSTRRILMKELFSHHSKASYFNHIVRNISDNASCSFATS
ncbi:Uncharacterised protein [Bacillus freudenreichii]|nr:Uncharacterised protein [Bacillus freudenreichii]